jgi:hypothetical protein
MAISVFLLRAKNAIAQNDRSQTSSSFQKLKRPGRKGLIHPVARPAFFSAAEPNPLDLKLLADELIQVAAGGNRTAPEHRRGSVSPVQLTIYSFVSFQGKKVIWPL